MGYQCFDVEIDRKVAKITLSRPEKRNSMIPEFWDELPAIVQEIDGGSKARVIVISSTGPHFCAGLDLGSFGVGGDGADLGEEEQQLRRRTRGARRASGTCPRRRERPASGWRFRPCR